jgi:hypothetical protein
VGCWRKIASEEAAEGRGKKESGRCKRRHPDSNRGVEVLQTSALPLGYAAHQGVTCCRETYTIITRPGYECKGFLPPYYPEL